MSQIVRDLKHKPHYLRPPAWRWSVALECLADNRLMVRRLLREARIEDDEWLVTACSFCAQRDDLLKRPLVVRLKYPEMNEAFQLHVDSRPEGGFRWILEALLMTDADDEAIASQFQPLYGAKTIEHFRKVFFDVESLKASPLTALATVFASSAFGTTCIDDMDFTWKAFAHQMGFDAFLDFLRFRSGGRLPQEYLEFMHEVDRSRAQYASYHASSTLRSTMTDQAVAAFERADRLWNLDLTRDHLGGSSGMGRKAAQEIMDRLEEALLDPNIESRVAELSGYAEILPTTTEPPDLELERRVMASVAGANDKKNDKQ